MSRPQLPSYSSPENTRFHPVFKFAMETVLANKGLTHFVVKSQYPSGTGPIDLVLFNNQTNKVVLPIELKRTQTSVRGGGRRQARDYWGNLGLECESSFYCVSNLELVELFRNDPYRPKTSAQRVFLQFPVAGKLDATPIGEFYRQLELCLNEVIDLVTGNCAFNYFYGLPEFQGSIERAVNDPHQWHKLFVPVCFEYIRGAASKISELHIQTNNWKTADFYKSSPQRLLDLGKRIDFKHIFKVPTPDTNDSIAFATSVLKAAYESGKELGRGDDIAELVNEILAPTGSGIVETDVELAQLLAIMAKDALGRELDANEEVFDPGSGSGRLLTALPLIAFPSIAPKQIKANEKEQLFAESLSLRLGLAFASVLSPNNAPSVTVSGIETVDPGYLTNVKVVVMNPPYLSGVQSAGIKPLFINRIRTLARCEPELNIGQVALEIVFFELVWHLVQEQTVIAMVFPMQHLTRTSDEVVAFRRFLGTKFGLTHIVIHPREGLFNSVVKQTVLLVGIKGQSGQEVKLVEVQQKVGDLDLAELLNKLNANNTEPTYGVTVKTVSRQDLLQTSSGGWKCFIGSGERAKKFINTYFHNLMSVYPAQYMSIQTAGFTITRGKLGNKGNTSLTVFDAQFPKHPTVINKIPSEWIRPALNTTHQMPRVLDAASAPHRSFLPPSTAFVAGHPDNQVLAAIVDEYIIVNRPKQSSQAKAQKSITQIIKDLSSDQKDMGGGWVLIQRASRQKGEISLLESDGVLLSTNIPMIKAPNIAERELMASWLLSVFGQLQFELYATDQEGMRKLELSAIKQLCFPDFKAIDPTIASELQKWVKNEPALSFDNIQQRNTDRLWAEIVCPSNSNECLAYAFNLFESMVDERRGFGAG